MENDNLSADEYLQFLRDFVENMTPFLEGDLYVKLGSGEWPTLDRAIREAGYHWSATIIWVKDEFVLGRSKYHRRYEPIWYGWHTKNKSSYQGERDQDDVWEFPRNRVSELHPTMMPIEMVSKAILNSSPEEGIVLDQFVGSGTTLLACENLNRQCRAMEKDPKYVAVVLERWSNLMVGEEPILLDS
jgi:DNA modification methylase